MCNSKVRHEEFVKLWNEGVKGAKIAKHFGVSDCYVYDYAKTHRDECAMRRTGPGSCINDKEKFIEMWKNGVLVKNIAKYFNCTLVAVTDYARRHRKECPSRKGNNNKISDEDKEEFIGMWNNGVPAVDIALHFDVPLYNVLQFASKYRDYCPRRIRDEKSRIDHDLFVKMWNEDLSCREIGKVFNVGKSRIYKYAGAHRDECVARRGGWSLRKIDPEVFAQMWNEGCSCKEIAEHFGVTEEYVKHFKACSKAECMNNLQIRHEKKIIKKELVALLDKGVSSVKIAEHFGVSQSAVCHYIKRNLQ